MDPHLEKKWAILLIWVANSLEHFEPRHHEIMWIGDCVNHGGMELDH